jgi:predicted component of type VI protein secretion system
MATGSFQMVMRSGPTPGKVFPLEKNEIYVGRDVNNDVVISDSEVSRKHARITLQAGGHVLEDLGSTNGTFVNGQRLMGPHLLRQGELIMLGENVSLTFEPGFDPDATMVSSPGPAAVFPQTEKPYEPAPLPPRQEYPAPAAAPARQDYAPPPPQPVRQPTYTGQVPQGPAEPYYEPEPVEDRRRSRTWIYAGCGCLLVLVCLLAAGAYAFDYLNLYCTPPFNLLFACP